MRCFVLSFQCVLHLHFLVNNENSEDSEYSSMDEDENEGLEDVEENNIEISADETEWTRIELGLSNTSKRVGRAPAHSIIKVFPGPTPFAKRKIIDKVSAFEAMIDEETLQHIQHCTETEARLRSENKKWSMPMNELKAFIGVLYARGALGLKNMSVANIFSTKYGSELIRGTMSRVRFKVIMRYLRFDIKETRTERLADDKFAMISQVWNKFIYNCQSCYAPGENITIDEQLFPSKTRCPFTHFMPKKPDKFGQKYYLAVDLASKYLLNGFPYVGPDKGSFPGSESDNVVLRLMQPFFGNGYTVTCDNFFTSVNVANILREKRISLVGTLNKNRRFLPATARKKNPGLELYETILFSGPKSETLTLYQCKKSKSIGILSSLHKHVEIEDSSVKKPDTILYYNNTKYGVDILDSMAKAHSVKAASRRWPVHSFYNILDLAGVNAWILYKNLTGSKISRLHFLLQLADDLRTPHKLSNCVPSTRIVVNPNSGNERVRTSTGGRLICQTPKCRNKSLGIPCSKCSKTVCGKCVLQKRLICRNC